MFFHTSVTLSSSMKKRCQIFPVNKILYSQGMYWFRLLQNHWQLLPLQPPNCPRSLSFSACVGKCGPIAFAIPALYVLLESHLQAICPRASYLQSCQK